MPDPYPSTLDIEIDRVAFRKYLRMTWLYAWVVPCSFLGAFIGFSRLGPALAEHQEEMLSRAARELFKFKPPTLMDLVLHLAKYCVIGVLIGFAVGVLCYFIFSHRFAARKAASLQVTVEGAFLRIRQHVYALSDRKLHFRAIVDYEVTQDFFMRRAGIEALRMRTTSAVPGSIIIIPAIKDCLKVRDMLSEIDALREHP